MENKDTPAIDSANVINGYDLNKVEWELLGITLQEARRMATIQDPSLKRFYDGAEGAGDALRAAVQAARERRELEGYYGLYPSYE